MDEIYKKILNINECSLDYENMDFHSINILLAALFSAFYDEHAFVDSLTDLEISKAEEMIKQLIKVS